MDKRKEKEVMKKLTWKIVHRIIDVATKIEQYNLHREEASILIRISILLDVYKETKELKGVWVKEN